MIEESSARARFAAQHASREARAAERKAQSPSPPLGSTPTTTKKKTTTTRNAARKSKSAQPKLAVSTSYASTSSASSANIPAGPPAKSPPSTTSSRLTQSVESATSPTTASTDHSAWSISHDEGGAGDGSGNAVLKVGPYEYGPTRTSSRSWGVSPEADFNPSWLQSLPSEVARIRALIRAQTTASASSAGLTGDSQQTITMGAPFAGLGPIPVPAYSPFARLNPGPGLPQNYAEHEAEWRKVWTEEKQQFIKVDMLRRNREYCADESAGTRS